MKERTAWPSILALALLRCWVEPTACAAQPPAINPVTSQGGQPLPASLPSAVSSDIERFVRQSGRDLPPSTPLPAADSLTGRVGGSSPLPPPRLPPAVIPTAIQEVRALPPALPPLPSTTARTPGSGGPAATVPSPLATNLRLKPAPFAPTDLRFPISL